MEIKAERKIQMEFFRNESFLLVITAEKCGQIVVSMKEKLSLGSPLPPMKRSVSMQTLYLNLEQQSLQSRERE